MQITTTEFQGLVIIDPDIFKDSRGAFYESFNSKKYLQQQLNYFFVQDNEAESQYGVIRGLHFQKSPMAQAKLVRVISGEVLDVVVDLRASSATYGKVFTIYLSGENKKQLMIPAGFAHGYSVLSPNAIFNYKCDNYYSKINEAGIHPLDPSLNIDWMIPQERQIISSKDLVLPNFDNNIKLS
jgi:dTDP-4-dehydrorhamnose 3,5-epimerase